MFVGNGHLTMGPSDEEFRRQCEARYVMKMNDERRKSFYEGVFKNRGRERAQQLVDDVNQMRKTMKEVAK